MNGNDVRSSLSSYGDVRHLSAASLDAVPPQPPAKILLDGYQDGLDPQHEEKSRYNPVYTALNLAFLSHGIDLGSYADNWNRSLTRRTPEAPRCSTPMTPLRCTC